MERLLETLTLRIRLLTPLRIGGGAEGNLQQQLYSHIVAETTLETRDNGPRATGIVWRRLPVIPATTVKGLLRATTERIAATLYASYASTEPKSIEELPRLLAALHHQPDPEEAQQRRSQRLQQLAPLHSRPNRLKPLNDREDTLIDKAIAQLRSELEPCRPKPSENAPLDWAYEALASRYCPICILYGSTHQAGAIRPLDAIPQGEPRIRVRAHVAIDRALKTKSEAKLYTEELVEAGIVFTARIHILWPLPAPEEKTNKPCKKLYETALAEAKRLWRLTHQYLEQATIQLGSGKSRGTGLAKVVITSHAGIS